MLASQLAYFLVWQLHVLGVLLLGSVVIKELVLTEDGSIDTSTSLFVSWSTWILAAVLILKVLFNFPSLPQTVRVPFNQLKVIF